ncbi:PepSY-associated TM helix domain-containing protein [Plebeiibacterium sediminum]|uniref:PepSY-associated TM helix domain-containing protein n=1 Tax=Plebeiibacterium sediminum TaxID=2992112 RepID=A0AAE3M7V3_9BACT|nr:PepSY-associated TM helix domain-containing protein [Plebeiobacterium sediminum]MCW3788708.1 PepSY-associated TM helix domain-containing protein [Plebeiobacterium sediminum]
MKFRKLNRIIHRDLGYFFTGMIIIYALSGIALNHKHDWNPNYIINTKSINYKLSPEQIFKSQETIDQIITLTQTNEEYKKHYYPQNDVLKIFLSKGSTITFNNNSGSIFYEELKSRPLFSSINFLHFNPGIIWKYFSDVFAISLIVLAISGSVILKGKNGFKWRGLTLITLGLIIPIIIYFLY